MDSSHPVNLTHGTTAQPRYPPQVSHWSCWVYWM